MALEQRKLVHDKPRWLRCGQSGQLTFQPGTLDIAYRLPVQLRQFAYMGNRQLLAPQAHKLGQGAGDPGMAIQPNHALGSGAALTAAKTPERHP